MEHEQWRYLQLLLRALREEGVPGERVGELVAEMATHIEDGDVDPVAEFGRPGLLAAELAGRERRVPRLMRSASIRLGSLAGAMIGAAALVAGFRSDPAEITAGMIGLALGQAILIVGIAHLTIRKVDGRSMASAITPATLGVLLGGAAVVATLASSDAVVLRLARPTALGLGVVLLSAGLLIAWLVDRQVRFPEHAQHLDRLRSASWRRPVAG